MLELHTAAVNARTPHGSSQCSNSTRQQSMLELHTAAVNARTPHGSSQCSNSTRQQSMLELHTAAVNARTPHGSSQCSNSTWQQSMLELHTAAVNARIPHGSSQCSNSTRQQSMLELHTSAVLSTTEVCLLPCAASKGCGLMEKIANAKFAKYNVPLTIGVYSNPLCGNYSGLACLSTKYPSSLAAFPANICKYCLAVFLSHLCSVSFLPDSPFLAIHFPFRMHAACMTQSLNTFILL